MESETQQRSAVPGPRPWIAPALVALGTAALQLPIFDRFTSPLDEGHVLAFADLVARGEGLLYRDATLYPLPGAFYLLAGVFDVFGASIRVARWVVVLEFALFVALLFAWLRRCVTPGLALAAVGGLWLYRIWAFPHWQMYSYSTTALLVLVCSLGLLVRALASDSRRGLAAAGLVWGLGVFCKQDYGAAFGFASFALLWLGSHGEPLRRTAGRVAIFATAASMVGAAAALHFLAQGQLALVLQMTFWNAFEGLRTFSYSEHPDLWPLFAQDPALRDALGIHTHFPAIVETVHGAALRQGAWFRESALYDVALKLFVHAPLLGTAGAAAWAWRRRDALADPQRRDRALHVAALLAVAFASSALSLLNRPQDYLHSAVLMWPLPCLFACAAGHWPRGARRRRIAAGCVAAALALPVVYSFWLAASLRTIFDTPVPLARAGVYERPADAALLAELADHIEQHSAPGERVAVLPYFPLLHFLAERHAPHGASYLLWPFPEIQERDRAVARALDENAAPIALVHFTELPQFPPMREFAPELTRHLVRHYRIERVFGRDAFGHAFAALRREPPPAGSPLSLEGAKLAFWSPRAELAAPRPEARAHWLRRVEDWPFRPALALRPLHGGSSVLRIPLDALPDAARLESAIGVHPRLWSRDPPSPVRFALWIERGPRRERVFQRTLNPHLVLEDRGWFELNVPLAIDGEAAEVVELRTSLGGAPLSADDALWMGGWEWPRWVVGP